MTTNVLCPVGNFLLGPVVTNTTVTVDDIDIMDGDLQLGQGGFTRATIAMRRRMRPARRVATPTVKATAPRPRAATPSTSRGQGACLMRKVVYSRYHAHMRGMLGV